MEYNITVRAVRGHYEAFIWNNTFICSGDTYSECYDCAIEILENENK